IAAVSIDSHAGAPPVAAPVAPASPAEVPAAPTASAVAAPAPPPRLVAFEVGARAGVGAAYSGNANPLGFGLGGRAGVVLFDHLYVGGSLLYSFGANDEPVHTWMYGGEAGWG